MQTSSHRFWRRFVVITFLAVQLTFKGSECCRSGIEALQHAHPIHRQLRSFRPGNDDCATFTGPLGAKQPKKGDGRVYRAASPARRRRRPSTKRRPTTVNPTLAMTKALQRKDQRPPAVAFRETLNEVAKSRKHKSAQRAQDLLLSMVRKIASGEETDVALDVTMFNTVIASWARSRELGAGTKAERLLRLMESLAKCGEHAVKPDATTHDFVISAYGSCGEEEGGAKNVERLRLLGQRACYDRQGGS